MYNEILLSWVTVEHTIAYLKALKKNTKQKNVTITMVQYFPYSIHLSEAKLVDSAQL